MGTRVVFLFKRYGKNPFKIQVINIAKIEPYLLYKKQRKKQMFFPHMFIGKAANLLNKDML